MVISFGVTNNEMTHQMMKELKYYFILLLILKSTDLYLRNREDEKEDCQTMDRRAECDL